MAATDQLLDRIPDESEVRQRIAENQREAAVLRSLLRVAKQKTDVRVQAQQRTPQREASRAS